MNAGSARGARHSRWRGGPVRGWRQPSLAGGWAECGGPTRTGAEARETRERPATVARSATISRPRRTGVAETLNPTVWPGASRAMLWQYRATEAGGASRFGRKQTAHDAKTASESQAEPFSPDTFVVRAWARTRGKIHETHSRRHGPVRQSTFRIGYPSARLRYGRPRDQAASMSSRKRSSRTGSKCVPRSA
jgi:hypothetical protein